MRVSRAARPQNTPTQRVSERKHITHGRRRRPRRTLHGVQRHAPPQRRPVPPPEGHHRHRRADPKEERITAPTLEQYVRQTPNKRFLGTNFYVWAYNLANPDKDNWWNNFKRKVGEEPVLLDMSLTEKSVQNLKTYMNSRGYYASTASFEVDTTRRQHRAYVTYRTRQGQPYRIDTVSYDFRDRSLKTVIDVDTASTLIRAGDIFDITMLDKERERIAAYLNNRGYYNFSVNNIEYLVDTLGRRPPRRRQDDHQAQPHGIRRPRPSHTRQQCRLPHHADQRAARLQSHRGARAAQCAHARHHILQGSEHHLGGAPQRQPRSALYGHTPHPQRHI